MSLPAPFPASLIVFLALGVGQAAAEPQLSLIDDFSAEVSALGTRWEGFTDQVMGGVSQMQTRIEGSGAEARLRTTRTVFPWSLYAQGFAVSDEWSTVYLPFEGFRSENMARSELDRRKLVSVGIVAAKREFSADLEVDWVAFYR